MHETNDPASGRAHWERVYATKRADELSWFAPHLDVSLGYVRRTGVGPTSSIIDVGGGEATLVDDLLADGYVDVSVLDLSARALDVARERLGARAGAARWIVADVLAHDFEPGSVDVWHDRAVFHFLTTPAQRRAYVGQVLRALKPGGYCIVGTFGPAGPLQCSGLPVARYDAEGLHAEFGAPFQLATSGLSEHTTPWGAGQQFVYCLCRRAATASQ
jgi:SAM-dependent methyltransferase